MMGPQAGTYGLVVDIQDTVGRMDNRGHRLHLQQLAKQLTFISFTQLRFEV